MNLPPCQEGFVQLPLTTIRACAVAADIFPPNSSERLQRIAAFVNHDRGVNEDRQPLWLTIPVNNDSSFEHWHFSGPRDRWMFDIDRILTSHPNFFADFLFDRHDLVSQQLMNNQHIPHLSFRSSVVTCQCGQSLSALSFRAVVQQAIFFSRTSGPLLARIYAKDCVCDLTYFPGFHCLKTDKLNLAEQIVWDEPTDFVMITKHTIVDRDILRQHNFNALAGMTIQHTTQSYNMMFEDKIKERYKQFVPNPEFEERNLNVRSKNKFRLSRSLVEAAELIHSVMNDADFLCSSPEFVPFLGAAKLTPVDLKTHANYVSLRAGTKRMEVIDKIIDRMYDIQYRRLPSRWIICHRCFHAGCRENMYVLDGFSTLCRKCCCCLEAMMPTLRTNNPATGHIFQVCAADPTRGSSWFVALHSAQKQPLFVRKPAHKIITTVSRTSTRSKFYRPPVNEGMDKEVPTWKALFMAGI